CSECGVCHNLRLLKIVTRRTLHPISYLVGLKTCPPGALYPNFRTWWGSKHAHQAHFTPIFVPGGAQNMPTRRTFAGFSYLVLFADSAMIL
ncbi:MAG: hypothetical protein PHZ01_02595, partial [Bacteroidales bacterium]|nr:hypothetical protein [Bacteroidales bacterium]